MGFLHSARVPTQKDPMLSFWEDTLGTSCCGSCGFGSRLWHKQFALDVFSVSSHHDAVRLLPPVLGEARGSPCPARHVSSQNCDHHRLHQIGGGDVYKSGQAEPRQSGAHGCTRDVRQSDAPIGGVISSLPACADRTVLWLPGSTQKAKNLLHMLLCLV